MKDTTYVYDNIEKARKAVQMMDIIASDESMHKEMHFSDDDMENVMVFRSEDGEVTEFKGDNMVWVTTGEKDGNIEVTVKKITEEDGKMKEEVRKEIISKGSAGCDDGEWTIEEGEDGENVEVIVIKKRMKGYEDLPLETIIENEIRENIKEGQEVEVTVIVEDHNEVKATKIERKKTK